jgi:hypothetical protein
MEKCRKKLISLKYKHENSLEISGIRINKKMKHHAGDKT